MSRSDVARTFSKGFAEQLSAVEPGRWQGPILSSFGAHFIFVDERAKGRLPPLDTIREAVQREWVNAHRIEAEQKLYRALLCALPDRSGGRAKTRRFRFAMGVARDAAWCYDCAARTLEAVGQKSLTRAI